MPSSNTEERTGVAALDKARRSRSLWVGGKALKKRLTTEGTGRDLLSMMTAVVEKQGKLLFTMR